MRRAWAGVNASDVNHSAGRYMSSPAEAESKLPYGAGFEAVGVIAAVGPAVSGAIMASILHPMWQLQTRLCTLPQHAGLMNILKVNSRMATS